MKRKSSLFKSKKEKNPSQDWWQEHAQAKIHVLKEKAEEAFKLLKKKHQGHSFYHKSVPWFLVIGSEGSGKTSLLATSGLELTGLDNQPLSQANPTSYCDWWLSKKAVFIDTSGGLITPKKPSNDAYFIWNQFVNLLSQHRRHSPADGIILCVDLNDFQLKNHDEQQIQIDVLRHRVQALNKYKYSVPLYLVFTQCDHIAGFTETYNTLGPEEMHQIFGLSFPDEISKQNLSNVLNEKFDHLLQKINEQLLGHLHREHRLEKRSAIKNFPLQLESQKRNILQLAAQLHSQKTNLKGIYFTSSLQDGKINDILTAQSHHFGLSVASSRENFHLLPQKKSFFIQNLLKKIIKESLVKRPVTTHNLIYGYTKFYTVCASIFLLAGLFISFDYFYQKNALGRINLALNKYTPLTQTNSDDLVTQLSLMKKLNEMSKQYQNPLGNVVFKQNQLTHTKLENLYQNTLQKNFSPILVGIFENRLKNADKLNAQALFETLKAYLMLNNPAHLDKKFVAQWFKEYWQETLSKNPKAQKQLMANFDDWISQKPQNFNINKDTVKFAQKTLNGFSLSELAYLTLIEKYDTKERIQNAGTAFSIKMPTESGLYSPENIQSIYKYEIPEVAHQIINGDNWVLNITLPTNLTGPLSEQLISDLRQLYLQRYAIFWQKQLFNATVNTFKNMKEAHSFAATFSQDDSPVLTLLNVVEEKLKPLQQFPEAKQIVDAQNQIHTILVDALKDDAIVNMLSDLNTYLENLNSAENTSIATLKASQERMRHHESDVIAELLKKSKSVPAPFNHWLNALATNTWQTMLQTSRNQLNLAWMTEILPKYNEYIKDRYPIFHDSKHDISLEAFTDFFGPAGIMDTFLKNNLSAFADTGNLYWKWKTVDGQQLNISQKTLEMINLTSVIKQMFFPENQKALNLKFAMMPDNMEEQSANYLLNLGGNTIDYTRDFKRTKSLVWSPQTSDKAWFEMNKNQQKEKLYEEKGTWALFKLFTYANIKPTKNTRVYHVIFDANGIAVPYKLTADYAINPFIPDLMTEFRCPKTL